MSIIFALIIGFITFEVGAGLISVLANNSMQEISGSILYLCAIITTCTTFIVIYYNKKGTDK